MSTETATSSPLSHLADWTENYRPAPRVTEVGSVVSVGDGITWIRGLPSAAMDELVHFDDGSLGQVFQLGAHLIGAILLQQTARLTAGTLVRLSQRVLSLPVGDTLLGRVLDPLGNPLDGGPPPLCHEHRALESSAPAIIIRDFVHEPLYTGLKIVDTMIPIGRGQRQLILGDNGTGKSSLTLDTIINQHDQGTYSVYVLIGQKRSTVINVIDTLRYSGALEYTALIVAEATALPGLKYLAPYAGCAVAEHWMHRGHHTLVVFDDLTTHAQTYRELSLLLNRPPGREAYPGDIFHIHARLLERATSLAPAAGGGSLTALPIVETKEGDIASYIPTNLISITDGQIYLDKGMFAAGRLPAIDVTRSVSRIGGKAQHPRLKQEAGRMKLDYLQFLELEAFTRFGTRLEASLELKIKRGKVLRASLEQERLSPASAKFLLAWMIAVNEGLLDDVTVEEIPKFMDRITSHLRSSELDLQHDRSLWVNDLRAWLDPGSTSQEQYHE